MATRMIPDQAHPYMAISPPGVVDELLAEIGLDDVDELFEQIPESHRLSRPIELPPAIRAEAQLKRHLTEILSRNATCAENLSFLGAGCWQHYVPAVCDEIISRSEFLTPVWGTPASDFGRNQAWFEYASQLGELVEMDFVGLPVYTWGCAAGNAARMAARLTGRDQLLVPASHRPGAPRGDPELLRAAGGAEPRRGRHGRVRPGDGASRPRRSPRQALRPDRRRLSRDARPSSASSSPTRREIAELARAAGAETIAGVDPISLGVLAPPGAWGADIVVGTTQPLGVHMHCGGGAGGFIATRDEERYAREYPTLQVSICDTIEPGERTFGVILFEQTSYGARENGKDWTGNSVYLWAIANAVYMALMGPQGFARHRPRDPPAEPLRGAQDRRDRRRAGPLRTAASSRSSSSTSARLGARSQRSTRASVRAGSSAGRTCRESHPELGQSALYCVTEVHTQADVDRLVSALVEVTSR